MRNKHPFPKSGRPDPDERAAQRLRRAKEKRFRKMRERLKNELVETIIHVQCVALVVESAEFDLFDLIDRLQEALSTLREEVEQLNNPEHHIRNLRQIRKRFPLPRRHDSGDLALDRLGDGVCPGASDEGRCLLWTQATSKSTPHEPGKSGITDEECAHAAVDDLGGLGNLVDLDRYRSEAANRAPKSDGAVSEEGLGHEGSEVVPSPYTHHESNTILMCVNISGPDHTAEIEDGATAFRPHARYRKIPEGKRLNAMVDDLMAAICRSRTPLTARQKRTLNEMSYTIAEVVDAFSGDSAT